jgi:cytidine deaminase
VHDRPEGNTHGDSCSASAIGGNPQVRQETRNSLDTRRLPGGSSLAAARRLYQREDILEIHMPNSVPESDSDKCSFVAVVGRMWAIVRWFFYDVARDTWQQIKPSKKWNELKPEELERAIRKLARHQSKAHFEWLYGVLTVLDGKAGGLLGVNALLLAVVALLLHKWLGSQNSVESLNHLVFGLLIAGIALLTRAAFESLFVLHMKWPWLIHCRGAMGNPRAELNELLREADSRALRYRYSWTATVVGTICVVVAALLMLFSYCSAGRPEDTRLMQERSELPSLLGEVPSPARSVLASVAAAPEFEGIFSRITVETALRASPGLTPEALMLGLLPLARSFAVVPTSGYRVGAVAEGESGALYLGANFESKRLPLGFTLHAEQSAIAQAHSAGETALLRMAITAAPCGHCRQFFNELTRSDDLEIVLVVDGEPRVRKLKYLLPASFGPRDLGVEGALLAHGLWPLRLPSGSHSDLVRAALGAAAMSYSPYTRCPSGVALRTSQGTSILGSYAESAAYNPSLSPLLAALCKARFRSIPLEDIVEIVLVESRRAVDEPGGVSQEELCRLLATKLLPKASVTIVRCE